MKQPWKKSQIKNLDVLGPLGKLWLSVDAINNYKQGHQEGEPPKLSGQEAQHLIEQAILLLGQTHNFLMYERRKNILSCLMSQNSISQMLKDKAETLSKSDSLLFGNEFRSWIHRKPKESQLRLFRLPHRQLRSPFVKAPQAAITNQLFAATTITARREVLGGHLKGFTHDKK